jgi:hypothetical protein
MELKSPKIIHGEAGLHLLKSSYKALLIIIVVKPYINVATKL